MFSRRRVVASALALLSLSLFANGFAAKSNAETHPPTKRARAAETRAKPNSKIATTKATAPKSEFISVGEIKPGMEGYGLTVFRGAKIERFPVTVIDVMKRAYLSRDMILVRVHGPIFDQRKAMSIEGMSGSPIYLDGRLAGAYSMSFSFQNEPVALVTPISYMLEAWDKNLPQKPMFASASGFLPNDQRSPTLTALYGSSGFDTQLPQLASVKSTLGIASDAHPSTIYASGLSDGVLSRLNQRLAGSDFQFKTVPMGKSTKTMAVSPLQAGSAFGFELASGDVEVEAFGGTVTYRRGDKILTLGHPALPLGGAAFGPLEAPLNSAYVSDILSSSESSFKLMTIGGTIGSLVMDTPFSAAGVVGRTPDTLNVTVNVVDNATGKRKTLRSKVMRHPLLTSQIIEAVADQAISLQHSFPGDVMAKVKLEINAEGYKPILHSNTFYAPFYLNIFALQDLDDLLTILEENEFGPVRLNGVTMNIEINPGRKTVRIERAFTDRAKAEPGDTVQLGIVLHPWRKEPYVKMVAVKIPEDMPDGRTAIAVTNGMIPDSAIRVTPVVASAGVGSAQAALPAPAGPAFRNVQQMLDRYSELNSNTDLVVRLIKTTTGVNILGERLREIPSPIADVLRSPRSAGFRSETDSIKTVQNFGAYLIGSAVAPITIQRKNYQEKGSTTARPAPSSSSKNGSSTPPSSATLPPTAIPASVGDDSGDDDDDAATISGVQPNFEDDSATPSATDDSSSISFLPSLGGAPPVGTLSDPMLTDFAKLYAQAIDSSDAQFLAKKKSGDKKEAPKKNDDSAKTAEPPKPAADKTAEPPKPDDKKPDASASDDKAKGPGRTATLWTLKSKAQFERGDGDGISVTSEGDVRLTPILKRTLLLDQDAQVWSYLPDGKGGSYIGTGSDGKIYHLDAKSAIVQTIETKELAIRSLAADSHGVVYAGGWPSGSIFKLVDGKAVPFVKVDAEYILALLADASDNLYAAVGPVGRILKIAPDGKTSVLFKSDEPHIVSLTADASGNLIAGTSDQGTVYRVTPDGKSSVLFDPQDKAVTALWINPKGSLYAGTSPKGRILKIDPDGSSTVLYEAKAPVMTLIGGSNGEIYAGAGPDVVEIDPDETVQRLDNDDQDQILNLNWASPDRLQAVSGNLAAVYSADKTTISGEYLSPVRDTETPSKWGHISWQADIPEGSSLKLSTRSGNTQEPDDTWNPWTLAYANPVGSAISSPAGRYLQFRASMTAGKGDKSPILKSVTLSYLTKNRPPSVQITAPAVADTWSGKQTIRWTATDPDKDTLTYDVFYSPDKGVTWKALKTEAKTETTAPSDQTGAPAADSAKPADKPKPNGPSAQDVMNQINSELDKDKTLTSSDRAMLDALLPTLVDDAVSTAPDKEMKPDPAPAGAPPLKPLSTTSLSWDTEQIPDGDYLVKVVASDKRSNPADALTDDDVIGPITIQNNKPVVKLDDKAAVVKNRTVTVKGIADGGKASLSTVSYRVDGGDWSAAESTDGFFDSPKEDFIIATDPLSPGDHTIEARATTTASANGSATMKITVK